MSTSLVNTQALKQNFMSHGKKYATMSLGRLLKFNKGRYESQGLPVPIGKHFAAQVDQVTVGWVKFSPIGELVEQKIGKLCDGFKEPAREELDCQDRSKWSTGRDGKPKDPWLQQQYLPLVSVENEDDVYTFVTATAGGFEAIGKLLVQYANRDMTDLPVIELGTTEYRHKTYGRVEKPSFRVIRWSNDAPAQHYPDFEVLHDAPEADSEIPF